jgi:hypothetical protein
MKNTKSREINPKKEKVTTDEHGRTQMESGQWSVASGQKE